MATAFQLVFSPPPKKPQLKQHIDHKQELPAKLVLAPFNCTPEINFGVVFINNFATKPLILFNPTNAQLTVRFTNIDSSKDKLSCDVSEVSFHGKDEHTVNLTWSPIIEGSFHKTIIVQDCQKSIRVFNVTVTGRCVDPSKVHCKKLKKTKGAKRGGPYSSNPQRFRNIANEQQAAQYTTTQKAEVNTTVTLSAETTVTLYDNSFQLQLEDLEDKENSKPHECSPFPMTSSPMCEVGSPLNLTYLDMDKAERSVNIKQKLLAFDNVRFSPATRRETYCIPPSSTKVLTPMFKNLELSKTSSDSFTDSLENSYEQVNDQMEEQGILFFSPPTQSRKRKSSHTRRASKRIVVSPLSSYKKKYRTSFRRSTSRSTRDMCTTPSSTNTRNQAVSSTTKVKHRKQLLHRKKTPTPKNGNVPKTPKCVSFQSEDPFYKLLILQDEDWIGKQQMAMIKWLNSLLTPPVEMESDDCWSVDVVDLWVKSSHTPDVRLAPSKEYFASVLYHSPQRLDTLRKAATALFQSDSVTAVLGRLAYSIDNKLIAVREDRDLHLDQGLRFKLLDLLSCYNPLWLRIGLETIYKEKIPLQNKRDLGGLGVFVKKNLFVNERVRKKHSHASVANVKQPSFKDAMKKFILKKFLMLMYFLDQAKMKKLIRHDPCLFVKTSRLKASDEILLEFCGDLVVGHGDILKRLRNMKYVLTYKQTCLDEYDYSIPDLLSLRDGVHLTRILEILFGEKDLRQQLRVPAISLLQKIHNVKVALDALESKCPILGDITPKDIVKGHREKTLSLLWQLVHNYLLPRYNAAATKIQRWWRKKVLIALRLKRMKRAAVTIQRTFRNFLLMKSEREKFLNLKKSVTFIQQKYRGRKITEKCRTDFLNLKNHVVMVQKIFRNKLISKKQRQNFLTYKYYVVLIQRKYRAILLGRPYKLKFETVRVACIKIQTRYRAYKLMLVERKRYLELKSTTIAMQARFRALIMMKKERNAYQKLKNATLVVQRTYRAKIIGQRVRQDFLNFRKCVVAVQRTFRNKILGRQVRNQFLHYRKCVIVVQQKYRSILQMRRCQYEYTKLKTACITVQRRYRAQKLMTSERGRFLMMKNNVILVQRRFRGLLQMRRERESFLKLRIAALLIQRKYRATKLAQKLRNEFLELKHSVVTVQRMFRDKKLTEKRRHEFITYRRAVVLVQKKYRAILSGRKQKIEFEELKEICIKLQRRYRSRILMRKERSKYLETRSAVITIQKWFRGIMLTRKQRKQFIELRSATVLVQRLYKKKLMVVRLNRQRDMYLKAATLIQQKYKAYKLMKAAKEEFIIKKKAAIKIQAIWRGHRVRKLKLLKDLVISVKTNHKLAMKGTLRERYLLAISQLKSSQLYSVVLRALYNLVTVTSLSYKLCEAVIGEGVIEIILELFKRANRSVPSLDLCRMGMSVLINLARHPVTAPAVWTALSENPEDGILLLIHIMKYMHDKLNDNLFPQAVTLLWILAQDEKVAKEMSSTPTLQKQLEQMVENIRRRTEKSTKTKKSISSLPALKPKWYLDNGNIIFDDHYFASLTLFNILYRSNS